MEIEIRQPGPGEEESVLAAAALFDHAPNAETTKRFLTEPTHHLLIAVDGDERAVGFISGVEVTHPDKGTELFLYELAVDEAARRQGVGRRLVEALAAVGRERGCYGMWVLTDDGNEAAMATYARAGGRASPHLMFEWDFTAS